eukprot:8800951-Alexandrium_andersonii.AAC.1
MPLGQAASPELGPGPNGPSAAKRQQGRRPAKRDLGLLAFGRAQPILPGLRRGIARLAKLPRRNRFEALAARS